MLAIDLPGKADEALAEFAEKDGHTREQLALDAVLEYISERQAIAIAEERLDELNAGRSSTVSLHEVMDRYGVER